MGKHSEGLRTLVCVKQVPLAAAIEFDTEHGTLRRDGIPTEVNTYDVRAVLAAVELREHHGGEVVVVTMGPPEAKDALEYCLALGADRAVHLCDRVFAGSDTLATARALARAIAPEAPDLVLCGRSSTDAETGNIGPEIAELLDMKQITGVRQFNVSGDLATVTATRETEDGLETLRLPLPATLVVGEDVAPERYPTQDDRAAAQSRPTVVLTADLSATDEFGYAGSPTAVGSVEVRTGPSRSNILLEEETSTQVEKMLGWLTDRLAGGSLDHESRPDRRAAAWPRSAPESVLVYIEVGPQGVRPVSRELLAAATEVAEPLHAQVDALVIGPDATRFAPELTAFGVDTVKVVDQSVQRYDTGVYTHILAHVIRTSSPRVVLFPSTTQGRDLAPRCAARLGLGLTADCVGLHVGEDGKLVQHKPAFGDGLLAMITSATSPELATIRPGTYSALIPNHDRQPRVQRLTVAGIPGPVAEVIDEQGATGRAGDGICAADIVVGVGMGAVGMLPQITELAEALGASIGCTRKVADTGILPRRVQIGLTGLAIAPNIYIAIGVRGAHEHVVGIGRAHHVLAIDVDEDSVMFDHADLAVLADCADVLPPLIDRLRRDTASRTNAPEETCIHA